MRISEERQCLPFGVCGLGTIAEGGDLERGGLWETENSLGKQLRPRCGGWRTKAGSSRVSRARAQDKERRTEGQGSWDRALEARLKNLKCAQRQQGASNGLSAGLIVNISEKLI